MPTSLELPFGLRLTGPIPELYYYGPWADVNTALAMVPAEIRHLGKTVGVLDDEAGILEYWWQTDTSDGSLIAKSTGGGGGGSQPLIIITTYADLGEMMNSSSLNPEQMYMISDYATSYTQPVTGTLITASVEPIIVTAGSANSLYNYAYSTYYPNDYLEYDYSNTIAQQGLADQYNGKATSTYDQPVISLGIFDSNTQTYLSGFNLDTLFNNSVNNLSILINDDNNDAYSIDIGLALTDDSEINSIPIFAVRINNVEYIVNPPDDLGITSNVQLWAQNDILTTLTLTQGSEGNDTFLIEIYTLAGTNEDYNSQDIVNTITLNQGSEGSDTLLIEIYAEDDIPPTYVALTDESENETPLYNGKATSTIDSPVLFLSIFDGETSEYLGGYYFSDLVNGQQDLSIPITDNNISAYRYSVCITATDSSGLDGNPFIVRINNIVYTVTPSSDLVVSQSVPIYTAIPDHSNGTSDILRNGWITKRIDDVKNVAPLDSRSVELYGILSPNFTGYYEFKIDPSLITGSYNAFESGISASGDYQGEAVYITGSSLEGESGSNILDFTTASFPDDPIIGNIIIRYTGGPSSVSIRVNGTLYQINRNTTFRLQNITGNVLLELSDGASFGPYIPLADNSLTTTLAFGNVNIFGERCFNNYIQGSYGVENPNIYISTGSNNQFLGTSSNIGLQFGCNGNTFTNVVNAQLDEYSSFNILSNASNLIAGTNFMYNTILANDCTFGNGCSVNFVSPSAENTTTGDLCNNNCFYGASNTLGDDSSYCYIQGFTNVLIGGSSNVKIGYLANQCTLVDCQYVEIGGASTLISLTNFTDSSFGTTCDTISIESGSDNEIGSDVSNITIGTSFVGNKIADTVTNLTFGNLCANNTFDTLCNNITIGDSFIGNILENIQNNTYGLSCTNNFEYSTNNLNLGDTYIGNVPWASAGDISTGTDWTLADDFQVGLFDGNGYINYRAENETDITKLTLYINGNLSGFTLPVSGRTYVGAIYNYAPVYPQAFPLAIIDTDSQGYTHDVFLDVDGKIYVRTLS